MKRAVREAWNPREREVEVFSRICEHGPMTKQLFDGATRDEAVPPFGLGLTGLTKVMKTRKDGHVDISHGEKVEGELDILITRRHEKRVESEGERQAEELYAASVRAFNAAREHERRAEWATFHRQQAERHRATLTALISRHEAQAAKYRENGHYHENHEKE
jgi:hypothetical protein